MRFSLQSLSAVAAAFTLLMGANVGRAAEFPDHAVHFIIGYAPGGGVDAMTRLIATKLSDIWHQPVIIENRPGADGTIASDLIAHAPADGYSLTLVNSSLAITPFQYKLNFDPVKDLAPVIEVASQPDVLVVNPALPVHSLNELIAYARQHPDQLNYGSAGQASPTSLEMILLMQKTGIKMLTVPYKSLGPAAVALLGGEVQLMFGTVSTFLSQVKAGSLRAIAVSATARVPVLPDVPTVLQASGIQGFEGSTWYGVLAPAATPAEIVRKLHDATLEALRTPDVQKSMAEQSFVMVGGTPEQFSKKIKDDLINWKAVLASLTTK